MKKVFLFFFPLSLSSPITEPSHLLFFFFSHSPFWPWAIGGPAPCPSPSLLMSRARGPAARPAWQPAPAPFSSPHARAHIAQLSTPLGPIVACSTATPTHPLFPLSSLYTTGPACQPLPSPSFLVGWRWRACHQWRLHPPGQRTSMAGVQNPW